MGRKPSKKKTGKKSVEKEVKVETVETDVAVETKEDSNVVGDNTANDAVIPEGGTDEGNNDMDTGDTTGGDTGDTSIDNTVNNPDGEDSDSKTGGDDSTTEELPFEVKTIREVCDKYVALRGKLSPTPSDSELTQLIQAFAKIMHVSAANATPQGLAETYNFFFTHRNGIMSVNRAMFGIEYLDKHTASQLEVFYNFIMICIESETGQQSTPVDIKAVRYLLNHPIVDYIAKKMNLK